METYVVADRIEETIWETIGVALSLKGAEKIAHVDLAKYEHLFVPDSSGARPPIAWRQSSDDFGRDQWRAIGGLDYVITCFEAEP